MWFYEPSPNFHYFISFTRPFVFTLKYVKIWIYFCKEIFPCCSGYNNNYSIYADSSLVFPITDYLFCYFYTSPPQGLWETDGLQCASALIITITSPCDLYPLTPHFYQVKLGLTGEYIFSYFCSKTKSVETR